MDRPQSLQLFDWAVIRLATYVAGATARPRLLFGSVTLLTKDRPRPVSGQGVEQRRIGAESGRPCTRPVRYAADRYPRGRRVGDMVNPHEVGTFLHFSVCSFPSCRDRHLIRSMT
jgi:hypothetical protein